MIHCHDELEKKQKSGEDAQAEQEWLKEALDELERMNNKFDWELREQEKKEASYFVDLVRNYGEGPAQSRMEKFRSKVLKGSVEEQVELTPIEVRTSESASSSWSNVSMPSTEAHDKIPAADQKRITETIDGLQSQLKSLQDALAKTDP